MTTPIVRLPDHIYKLADKQAEENETTLKDYVSNLILEELENRPADLHDVYLYAAENGVDL